MEHVSLSTRAQYWFENLISKGPIAIIGLLGVASLVVIVSTASVICILGVGSAPGEEMSVAEAFFQSFVHTLDAGTVAGDTGWELRALMMLVTLAGIFLVSILIGTITSGMEEKLNELRKGRSKVLETNHTLILGWSSKVHSIISELVIANENQKSPRVVILAPKDKVEMEDEIKARLPDTRNTKIICRTGSPLDLTDLEVVNPNSARSIIILSPEDEHADTSVIKSILAITNNPNRNGKRFHIVAEIQNAENMEAAELVGRDEATLVLSSDLIAKVTAQTCRQSGLSLVYTELLDFDGAEIYFTEEPKLVGKSYKDALFGFRTSAVIGIRRSNGETLLNPEMETVIEAGDKIIAISMDDDTVVFSGTVPVKSNGIVTGSRPSSAKRERSLILGWNDRGASILKELDNYVGPNSEVVVISETEFDDDYLSVLRASLENQTLEVREGNIADRRTLDAVGAAEFDHIVVLCYEHLDMQQADAKTLITLLHLRAISDHTGKDLSIVSEMLDIKNRDLAEIAKADDFIVSDKLVSLMLSQLSENRDLKQVFDQLFASEGSEVYLKPVEEYFGLGQETDFYSLVESAAQRGETAIGYRKQSLSRDPKNAYGVVVNPDKQSRIQFEQDDCLIVLAEN